MISATYFLESIYTHAATGNNEAIVTALQLYVKDINITDDAGMTMLHYALDNNQLDTVELLLAMGANFTCVSPAFSIFATVPSAVSIPLVTACEPHVREDVFQCLGLYLKPGMIENRPYGWSALHELAFHGDALSCRKLKFALCSPGVVASLLDTLDEATSPLSKKSLMVVTSFPPPTFVERPMKHKMPESTIVTVRRKNVNLALNFMQRHHPLLEAILLAKCLGHIDVWDMLSAVLDSFRRWQPVRVHWISACVSVAMEMG
jgi:hypothetical protein